jgi:diguanylate cyclase (GGDEF)-like protein
VIIALIVVYTVAIVFIALPKIDRTIKGLEEQNAKEVLDKVVMLTDNVARSLEDFREEAIDRHKRELKSIIDLVHTMVKSEYDRVSDDPNALAKCREALLERIGKLRYNKDNYIFAVDYNATMLSHPYIKKGSDMNAVFDIKGKSIVPRIVKVAREYGEGFTYYWWKRNKRDEKAYEKLTYSRDCTKFKMVVGTGVYIDDIEKEITRRKVELFSELREIMQKTKIGKTGYIYIFDENRMIIHPNSNIEGQNFKKLPNPGKGTYIYDDLVNAAKGSGVLRYKWDKPTDKGNYIYDKISWIRYVPSMKLYVVSSAYKSELEAIAADLHDKILFLGGVILIFSLVLSAWYLKHLVDPIQKLTETANIIAKGDYRIRAAIHTNDEIGTLARYFNMMVDRLQDQIQNLDLKVKEKTEELQRLAITDSLTQLYNRRYFSEISAQVFEMGKREHEPLSIMMIDIDRFKRVNDTYGHQVGDRVIIKLAEVIHAIKRKSDVACRYGGEEFVLLLPRTTSEGAFKLAQHIRKEIEKTEIVLDEERRIKFTVSLGVSEADYNRDSHIEEVIRRADDAMYMAKKEGRNRTFKL